MQVKNQRPNKLGIITYSPGKPHRVDSCIILIMTLDDLYHAMKALELRLIDANSEVSLSVPLDWLYKAIVHEVPPNLRLVPTLQEKLLVIEPEFKADLHSLIDDAKRLVQS